MQLTWIFDELELVFFEKPLSIPKSAKKLEDFGGATWLIACVSPVLIGAAWKLSTYSKRDVKDEPDVGALFVEVETWRGGSSGFWS